MTTGATLGHGAKIKLGDGATSEAFVAIGNVGTFSYSETAPLVDVTSHDSGGFKEYISDILDGDEITFPVFYNNDDASHNRATGLRGKKGQNANFQFEFNGDAEGILVNCVIIGVELTNEVEGAARMMNLTLKPSGAPSYYTIT